MRKERRTDRKEIRMEGWGKEGRDEGRKDDIG